MVVAPSLTTVHFMVEHSATQCIRVCFFLSLSLSLSLLFGHTISNQLFCQILSQWLVKGCRWFQKLPNILGTRGAVLHNRAETALCFRNHVLLFFFPKYQHPGKRTCLWCRTGPVCLPKSLLVYYPITIIFIHACCSVVQVKVYLLVIQAFQYHLSGGRHNIKTV